MTKENEVDKIVGMDDAGHQNKQKRGFNSSSCSIFVHH